MTGDSIYLLSNLETEKLDSLKVIGNAFIISEDTVAHRGYNQAKGRDLLGKFEENSLRVADLIGNTEVVYYMYDDDGKLIGINKTECSSIRLHLNNSEIEEITFFTDPEGTIYPEKDFPSGQRQLSGFIWRGDERIRAWQELFDEDDNNLVLPVIRGVNQPMDEQEQPPSDEEQTPDPPPARRPRRID